MPNGAVTVSFPATTSRTPIIWVFDDKHDMRRNSLDQLLTEASVRSYLIGQHTTRTKLDQLQHELTQQGPALLWINVQGPPTGLDNRATTRLKTIATLTTLQLMRQRAVLLEVPYKTSAAQYLQDHLPPHSITQFTIQHCNTGVHHPQSKRPSATKTHVITNIPITNPTSCECGKAESEHLRESNRNIGLHQMIATKEQYQCVLVGHSAPSVTVCACAILMLTGP